MCTLPEWQRLGKYPSSSRPKIGRWSHFRLCDRSASSRHSPVSGPPSAGVIPRSASSPPACSRSRAVSRQPGGTCGSDPVNVLRAQTSRMHFHRRFTPHTATGPALPRTSSGRAGTRSCTRAAGR